MTDVVLTSAFLSAGFVLGFAGGATKAQPADLPIETGTVHSIDGTRIGYTRVGSGPVPIVLVHGALSTGRNWMSVATALGTLTKEHPSFATESLSEMFEDVRIECLDGQGHTGHLGDPDQVAESIAGFLLKTVEK